MEPEAYTGDEDEVEWTPGAAMASPDTFEVRPPQVHPGSLPVVDEATGLVAGYRYYSGGFWMIWDLEGKLVEIGELPLEAPLLDPIDLLAGGLTSLLRGLGGGVLRSAGRGVAVGAGRTGLRALGNHTAMALHRVLSKLVRPGSLKFTATTAKRMADPARHVPLHILHLAIRHGKQVPDPQKASGAVMYLVPMFRNGKQYTLEVVVRGVRVLHFGYK